MTPGTLGWTVAISVIISWIICVFFFSVFCYRLNGRVKRIEKHHVSITMICYILIILYLFGDIIHFLIIAINGYNMTDYPSTAIIVINITGSSFYFISEILIYIILIYRLHFVFRSSIFEINTYILVFFGILISIDFIFMIGYLFNIALSDLSSHPDSPFLSYFNSASFRKMDDLIRTLIDIILNASCGAILIYKLRQLILLTVDDRMEDIDSMLSIELDQNQEKLIDLVTRQTILGVMATFINQYYNLTTFIISFYWDSHSNEHNLYLTFIFVSRAIEGAFNSLILFYFFSINSNEYYKCFGCCHRICYHQFRKHTKISLKKRRKSHKIQL